MAKVIGVGGIFFKSKDPAALVNWYRDVLGLHVHDWGGVFLTSTSFVGASGIRASEASVTAMGGKSLVSRFRI